MRVCVRLRLPPYTCISFIGCLYNVSRFLGVNCVWACVTCACGCGCVRSRARAYTCVRAGVRGGISVISVNFFIYIHVSAQVSEEEFRESLRQSQQQEAQLPPPNTVQVFSFLLFFLFSFLYSGR